MVDAFTAYIKTITALTVFSVMAELLLPEGKFSAFLRPILGALVLFAVLQPLGAFFHADWQLERLIPQWEENQQQVEESLSEEKILQMQQTLTLQQENGGEKE